MGFECTAASARRYLVTSVLLLVFCASAYAGSSAIEFSHSAPYDTYLPGGTVDVTVTFTRTGIEEVTALALLETLPTGWTFDSIVTATGGPAVVQIPDGVQFTWVTIPAFPFSITYRVSVPDTTTGKQSISGIAPYRLDGVELISGPVTNDIFEAQFSLTTRTSGTGEITPASGTIHLSSPQFFTLTVSETAPDWVFTGWSGDLLGDVNPVEILVDRDRDITANFTRTYQLTMERQGSGEIQPESGEYAYLDGTEVLVSAIPAQDFLFGGWEGDIDGSETRETIVMDRDRRVRAVFLPAVDLTISQVGSGTLDPASGVYTYSAGTQVVVNATPADGWILDRWEGGVAGDSPGITVTLFNDTEVTAIFRRQHMVTVSVDGGGNTIPAPGVYPVLEGDGFSVQAVPSFNFPFLGWGGSLTSVDNPLTVTVGDSIELIARFGVNGSEGEMEGILEGEVNLEGEGITEGDPEGLTEGEESGFSSADQDMDYMVSLSELLRVVQFYNSDGYACAVPPESSEDGYRPGPGDQQCMPYSADYNPQDWDINLSELLRIIQIFNSAGYVFCPQEEDNICPIAPDKDRSTD